MPRRVRETYHRLGELAVRRRYATPEAIDHALAVQRIELQQGRNPPRMGDILIGRKLLDQNTLRELLEEQRVGRGEKRVLRIRLSEKSGILVITLAGRLDQSTEPILTRMFEKLMNKGIVHIAVDAYRLLHLDSHGASSLVRYIDESRARGGDIKFWRMNSESRFTLDRLGLTRFIQLFDDEADVFHAFTLPIDDYMSQGPLGEYLSIATSRFYHLSYCTAVQGVSEEEKRYYQSQWHARESGKVPCRRCKP